MGSITRSFANNITTSGVLLPASLTNNSIANVTAYNASVTTGGMVLISSQTASNSATVSFTTGIDSTYKEYQFWFINIMPRGGGNLKFFFNGSTDGGSNYNVTKTSTYFRAYLFEDNTGAINDYQTADDLAQSTAFQEILRDSGSNSDECQNGFLTIYNPASTTFVKHFAGEGISTAEGALNNYVAGYMNTTSAVNAFQFKMSSGNFDGTILMYGIK